MKTSFTGSGIGRCTNRVCLFAIYLNEEYGYMAFSYSQKESLQKLKVELFPIFNGSKLNPETVIQMIRPGKIFKPQAIFTHYYDKGSLLNTNKTSKLSIQGNIKSRGSIND